jgi:hypothetical protein
MTVHVVFVMIVLQAGVLVTCLGAALGAANTVVKVKPPNSSSKLNKPTNMKRFTEIPPSQIT